LSGHECDHKNDARVGALVLFPSLSHGLKDAQIHSDKYLPKYF